MTSHWRIGFIVAMAAMATAGADPLKQAVLSALEGSPSIKRSEAQARAALHDITVERAARRPNMLIEGSGGVAFRDRSIDGLSTGSGDELFSRRAVVKINQLLYDWGATKALVESAKMRQIYQELLVEEAVQDQALFVVETYVEYLRFKHMMKLLERRVAFIKRQVNRIQGATEIATNRYVLEGRLARARGEFEDAKGRANAMANRYRLLTKSDAPSSLSSAEPKSAAGIVSGSLAADSSPQVRAARQAISSSEQNIAALKKDRLPKVSLELTGGAGEDVLGIRGPDNELSALAVFRWNPFDGGRKRALVERARERLVEDEAALDAVQLSVSDSIGLAMAQARGAQARYSQLANAISKLKSAIPNLEKEITTNAGGSRTVRLSTLIDAFEQMNLSQRQAVDAHYDTHLHGYRALAASGLLLNHLGVERYVLGGVASGGGSDWSK